MSRWFFRLSVACILLWNGFAVAAQEEIRTQAFDTPIDALSVTLPDGDTHALVRGFDGSLWTAWQPLTVETEFDPMLRESNLILFSRPVQRIEVRGTLQKYTIHPIRIAHDPVHWKLAARGNTERRILSREEWGADESFLLVGDDTTRSDISNETKGSNGEPAENGTNEEKTVPQRIKDCEEMQERYPNEFKAARTVTHDAEERQYRWPLIYSKKIRLLVVHHTAMTVHGDERSGVERVQALYQYHTNNRGWGDIGYHYLIDERGRIYEGRAGGPFVVGGHAYCNNTGTVGIALLGNFEVEKPTQTQMQSLQWLLDDLADRYDISLDRDVRFHGKILPPVVGHRDLLSTDCPGYYVHETLAQVRDHVRRGELLASIDFPAPPKRKEFVDRTRDRMATRLAKADRQPAHVREGIVPVGSLELSGPPGGQMAIGMTFGAGTKTWRAGAVVASIGRSDPGIGLWQDKNGSFTRVRTALNLPMSLKPGDTMNLRLKVQLPRAPGDYTLSIGPWTYTLKATGRRMRTPQGLGVGMGLGKNSKQQTVPVPSPSPQRIRIRLSYTGESARVILPDGSDVFLSQQGSACIADQGTVDPSGIVHLDAGSGVINITSWDRVANRFRGILECRVIDGKPVLINELPLESYLAGLAEEPDTEPFEKQRAFAIAARTYATYYRDPLHRKFPGMPFDGSDSPTEFQAYGGVIFEERNPEWVRAVRQTKGLVLTKDDTVIRTPYFSSDDGRTRSPEEAGWNNFPFAEIFASKPDPWCMGLPRAGHGVGMSGCGAHGQAKEGRSAEQILEYYYPGTTLERLQGRVR